MAVLSELPGVEEVMTREAASVRFYLTPAHIVDLVGTGDKDTMVGEMDTAHESLPATYRAHGSLHEIRLPLLIWNQEGLLPDKDLFQHNLDLTRFLFI